MEILYRLLIKEKLLILYLLIRIVMLQKFLTALFKEKKNILVMVIFFSCAIAPYHYKDYWQHPNDSLTWINDKIKIRITFPDPSWRVSPKPTGKVKWEYLKNYFTILEANVPELEIGFKIDVIPDISEYVNLEDFFTLFERNVKMVLTKYSQYTIDDLKTEIIDQEGIKLGAITIHYLVPIQGMKFEVVDFVLLKKGKDKAVTLHFICRNVLFQSKRQSFINIAKTCGFE